MCDRVWRARYNRCHDQLVVTSSTDSNVDLWRMASISSAPLLDTDEAECVSADCPTLPVGLMACK